MSTLTNNLIEFWLTKIEAEIYEISIVLWQFAASNIANILKIPRSTARYTCESLVNKWFMKVFQKANTKYFQAENPTKLFAIMYQEEEKLKQKKQKLNNIVSNLQKLYNPNAKIPKITIYEWIDGIEKMSDELLKDSNEMLSFWAGDYFLEKYPNIIETFRKKSKKQYKKVKILRAKKYEYLHQNDKRSEHRYFNHIDELKIDIQITEDKISIISLDNSVPTGILIRHQDIVNGFKEIFKELWERK